MSPPPASPVRPAHLVLGAGGVRVVSYVGALIELAAAGFVWQSISTCSAGTFVGALLAAGLAPADIEKQVLARDLAQLAGTKRALGALRMFARPYARYSEPGLPKAFREMVGGDPRFGDLKIPFATAGVDILSNRLLVYSSDTHPEMPVAEALRIAVGIPPLYPAYEPRGRVIVDAGLATQIPVWLATDWDDDLPIVAIRPRESLDPEAPQSFAAYLTRAIESAIASRDHYLVSQIPRVRVIEPDCGQMAADDFARAERIKAVLIGRGREAARAALATFDAPPSAIPVGVGTSVDDRAELRAERAMTRFNRSLSNLTRDRVFISYAHEDRAWLDRLQTFLKPYARHDRIEIWDDTRIRTGDRWREDIEQALRSTKVAVLLVTPGFLASDFIADEELRYFIRASRGEGLRILWIVVSSCAWSHSPLTDYQAANDPQQPLDTLGAAEQNRILAAVCEEVNAALLS